jgi:hypothetical protein
MLACSAPRGWFVAEVVSTIGRFFGMVAACVTGVHLEGAGS